MLINFLQVDITEDQTSPDQLRDAFRGIAKDKVMQKSGMLTDDR